MAGQAGGCTSRTLPKSSCLALAPLVAATGVALGAFARLGFIDYDSDVIRLCDPDAFPPAHRKPGMCRRSPSPCDRWHIRQPVPAARFTAVLPRGSGGDTGGARRNRQGMGSQRKDRGLGGPETSGVVAGNRGGPVWPLEVPVRDRSPTACDPSASLTGPALSRPERARPSAVDWRGLLARCGRPVLPDLGTARRVNPEPKDPKGGLTRLDGPGTSRRRPPAPGVHGCQVSAVGGALNATFLNVGIGGVPV
jgi:hypothetical protein